MTVPQTKNSSNVKPARPPQLHGGFLQKNVAYVFGRTCRPLRMALSPNSRFAARLPMIDCRYIALRGIKANWLRETSRTSGSNSIHGWHHAQQFESRAAKPVPASPTPSPSIVAKSSTPSHASPTASIALCHVIPIGSTVSRSFAKSSGIIPRSSSKIAVGWPSNRSN